ncbi:glycine--tRNA ligase subunit beta [Motiliproteus sediminis]|uniref:glycine--tRNA ligase subunit beta n=1 Tax=Motiliproteus sediminis TaxID=1468178 RepID=UPI001AEFEF85|nr:glycine--tRNA ligase subunit beta [Motiliproteus sediminis]
MSQHDFLVEIGTEELPPKALKKLSEAFGAGIEQGLRDADLNFGKVRLYAAPRRLAVLVESLDERQPDREIEKRGPSVKAPEKAVAGFARGCGVDADALEVIDTDKGQYYQYRSIQQGQPTAGLLAEIVNRSLAALPIPKRMRWGASKVEFVRPAHWCLMLLGDEVIDAEVLGHKAGRKTYGHRFHYNRAIEIMAPADYDRVLRDNAYVMADFASRRDNIHEQVTLAAQNLGATAVIDDDLLDEVTALVEWPVALAGRFEERFLSVPAEALISSMKEHQKYFHVVDNAGQIQPYFITVSNIESSDPQQVIAGNEKVIRPRLSDAAFFFETDKKQTLESRIDRLKPIVFQQQLGTLFDKTERIAKLAGEIASRIGGDRALAERAGMLCKTDLVTEMVLEFDDLQGLMGSYYAKHDSEHDEVAAAMLEQYLPKFAGDQLPQTLTGCAVAMADRLDTLTGLFGINQPPTGSKDPFALRRATLGVLRILVEKELDLDLRELLDFSADLHANLPARDGLADKVLDFMLERFRAWFEDDGVPAEVFQAVVATRPTRPLDFAKRVTAVNRFRAMNEATALAAANKRVSNILAKQEQASAPASVRRELLSEDAEVALFDALETIRNEVESKFNVCDYAAAYERLATLREPVDQFFDQVMVMADDEQVRNNRLALLTSLRGLFLRGADISLL